MLVCSANNKGSFFSLDDIIFAKITCTKSLLLCMFFKDCILNYSF